MSQNLTFMFVKVSDILKQLLTRYFLYITEKYEPKIVIEIVFSIFSNSNLSFQKHTASTISKSKHLDFLETKIVISIILLYNSYVQSNLLYGPVI